MAEDHRGARAEFAESLVDQVGLRLGRPNPVARARGVAVAGPVEGDHPVLGGGHVEQAARLEVLDHAAVAVQQHEGFAAPAFDVVQAHAVDLDEPTAGGIVPLGLGRKFPVDQGRHGEGRDRRRPPPGVGVIAYCIDKRASARNVLQTLSPIMG